jgi:hypothetical protein
VPGGGQDQQEEQQNLALVEMTTAIAKNHLICKSVLHRHRPYSANCNRLPADKLRLQFRVAIFQEHLDDLLEISVQLIQRLGLTVGPGEAGDIAHIETGVRALLNQCPVRLHFPRAPVRFARLQLRAVRLEAFCIVSVRTSNSGSRLKSVLKREPRL